MKTDDQSRDIYAGRAGGPQDLFFAASDVVPRPLITRGQGVWLYDNAGERYLDMSSGPVTANIGHGNQRVAHAMAKQAGTLAFVSARQARHAPNIALAARVSKLAGPGFERVMFSSGGSEAIEFAVKFLRQRALAAAESERRHVITCMPSYHGSTIGALGLSGDPANEPFLTGFGQLHPKVPAPRSFRLPGNHTAASYAAVCAQELENKVQELGAHTVLAFLIEPVGGLATGAVSPPATYLESVRSICDRYGIALVYDEVLCGAGRTGRFLAAHHFPEAKPDIIVMAKGLSAGYAPLGAVLVPEDWAEWLSARLGFGYTHTYSAHVVSASVALEVLDIYEEERLAERAEARGAYLRGRLEELQARCPIIGDVRGMGLLLALELVADKTSNAIIHSQPPPTDIVRSRGMENGLLIYSRRTAAGQYGDWIMVTPPLTITERECDELVERLERALNAASEDLRRQGVLS